MTWIQCFQNILYRALSLGFISLKSCLLVAMLSHFSPVWLCATLWTTVRQALLSTGFSRQEHCSGSPRPSPDPGIEPASLTSPALAGGFFTTSTAWEALCLMLELRIHRGFPGGTSGKEPTCQRRRHERGGVNPWAGKIPGGGHCHPLLWTEDPGGPWSTGSQRIGRDWSDLACRSSRARLLKGEE